MDIVVQFEPTVEEIRTAVFRNSRRGRVQSWLNAVIGIVGGLIVLVATTSSGLMFIGFLLAFYGVCFLAMALMTQYGVKGSAIGLATRLCTPTELRLTTEQHSWQRRDVNGEQLWSTTRILVSPTAWTFAVPPKTINIILPKRALNDADRATFEAFIANRDRKLVKTV
jgi:hypothetical protein